MPEINNTVINSRPGLPPVKVALVPLIFLLVLISLMLVFIGVDSVAEYSWAALFAASATCLVMAASCRFLTRGGPKAGMTRSARQLPPAITLLIFIALIATTWMLSGVVPLLMHAGMGLLSPDVFLIVTCLVCGGVSIVTGSSWTTIATVGVAFMGIGAGMGFSPGWTAGAIISGAYFGDKMSPLSDTTVIAASTCGVDLMRHIRYMCYTSGPAMIIALIVYGIVGLSVGSESSPGEIEQLRDNLASVFNFSPRIALIPVITIALLILRLPTLMTLAISAAMGLAGIFLFQPQLQATIGTDSLQGVVMMLTRGCTLSTGSDMLDTLTSTSGALGMLPTVILLMGSMSFAGTMIGTGMLHSLTDAFTRRLKKRSSLVGTTVAGGLLLNSATADQYLSIIISGNMFSSVYRKQNLDPTVLSRTIEDSTSVTSVLIPWNSCGVTQSAVLGVSTLIYAPFCLFNILSPLMSLGMASLGIKIREVAPAEADADAQGIAV